MANVLFNLYQNRDIPAHTRDTMKELQRQWDDAVSDSPSPLPISVGQCCGNPTHVGSPEGYTLECCGNHLVSDPREAIARIIDPHSFMPDDSGEYIVGEIVKQSRELAFRKADRILAALAKLEGQP